VSGGVVVVAQQLRRRVPGGIGRCASCLLGALAATTDGDAGVASAGTVAGVPVTLLAGRAPGGAGGDPLARWGFPVLTSDLPGPVLTRAWDLGIVRAPDGFSVVHAMSLAAPVVGRRAPGDAARSALVVTVHDMAWRHFPEATTARGRRWHEAALQRAFSRADVLVVPSKSVADEVSGAGSATGRVELVEWGADHLPAPDGDGASSVLAGAGVEGPYLLSVGTLEPRKNLRRLVAAYTKARAELPEPWPLVVVGPRGWGDNGLGEVGGIPGADGVVAVGMVDDAVLAGLYARARAFAYIPLVEGYGLPPLEAMAHGVPVVVATSVPSVEPGAGGESAALRVDPLSVPDIARALVTAATDGDRRSALVEGGSALVAGRTWRRVADAHLEIWRSLS
jgi:glycosyltransferase involved in cell wall biosynthesis